jgi:putative DNA primase/helicase
MAGRTHEKLSCESIARAALGEPVRREGAELLWRCPRPEWHKNGDAHQSLKVNSQKNVWACFPCNASGTAWQLAAFLGRLDPADKSAVIAWLRDRGEFAVSPSKNGPPRTAPTAKKRIAEFCYSADLRKVRLEPGENGKSKTFVWEHRECGEWKSGDGGIKDKPLYVNTLFRERDQNDFALGCEGEAKVDLAGTLGYPAFSFKNLTHEQCPALAGLEVVLWSDKDESGTKQCNEAAKVMHDSQQPRLIRMIAPPAALPNAGDIVDAVHTLGWGRTEIDELVRDAAKWEPTRNLIASVDQSPGVVMRCFADIEPEPLKWLWAGRIPLGKLTLLIGDPGLGKSLVTVDVASRLTRGAVFSDGALCEPGRAIFLSAEDDPADTIRPRLDAADADLSHVHMLEAVRVRLEDGALTEKSFNLETDVAKFEQTLRKYPDMRLIVIDPISAYLGGVDSHRDAEVRGLLAPLTSVAARYHVAIVGIAHLPKSRQRAVHSVIGSIGFAAAARAVWAVAADPEDTERRLMLPVKQNLAANTGGLAFKVEAPNGVPRLFWEQGTISLDVNDVLGGFEDRETRSARREVAKWLRELLVDGPLPVNKIKAEASAAGFDSWHTVRDAAQTLGIKKTKAGFKSGWEWSVPEDTACEDAVANTRQYGTFERVPENNGDSSTPRSEDATIQERGTFGDYGVFVKPQTNKTGSDDGLTCSRCGNREQNLAAALYHYKKLCPKL